MDTDPLTRSYPWYTPYQFAGNRPIDSRDMDGLEEVESVTAAGVLNLFGVENTARKMTAIEVTYRQNVRAVAAAGYSTNSSAKAAQILTQGGSDPITRALRAHLASSAAPIELTGNISIPVAKGSSQMASDVSAFVALAVGAPLALPMAAELGASEAGPALLQAASRTGSLAWSGTKYSYNLVKAPITKAITWLVAGSGTERLAAGGADVVGQVLFNSVNGDDYDVSSTLSAVAAPNRYFLSGLGAGVNLSRNDGITFDIEQGLTAGVFNTIGGRGLGALAPGAASQAGRALGGGDASEFLQQLPNLPLKAMSREKA